MFGRLILRGGLNLIRLQDIADLAGVSRTTVSNVLYGKTSRVSPKTIEKVSKLLQETGYVQNMGSLMLTKGESNLIGLVVWAEENHGIDVLVDPFVTEFLASFEEIARQNGYYVIIIKSQSIDELSNIMNKFYIDGFVLFGYQGADYPIYTEKITKSTVLIDAYPQEGEDYSFHNVGIDDFDGGYQVGKYYYNLGYNNALYLAEHDVNSDFKRWLGFKKGQGIHDERASDRILQLPHTQEERRAFYIDNISKFLKSEALFFSSDYAAIEAINCFSDYGIIVPDAISVIGFDDSIYCNLSRPKLTTVKQDVHQKAVLAFEKLKLLIDKAPYDELCVRSAVKLTIRDSVKKINPLLL